MSDDFGKSVKNPAYEQETEAQHKAEFPDHAHLENEKYAMLLKSYLLCVTKYL